MMQRNKMKFVQKEGVSMSAEVIMQEAKKYEERHGT